MCRTRTWRVASASSFVVGVEDLPYAVQTLLALALVLFAVAAVIAAWVARPAEYEEIGREDLQGLLEPAAWGASAQENLLVASRGRMRLIAAFRAENTKKARRLRRSLEALAGGVLLLLLAGVVSLAVES